MNKDQLQSTVRTVLKVGGGALLMKGYTDGSEWETITAGLVALAGFIWGLINRRTILGPTLITIGLAGTLALPLLTTGCKTVTDAAGNSIRVVDSNKVDRAAVILRNVVGDATAAGELLDPGSVQYLHLVVNVLDSAIAATNTAPAALRKTLATLPIKELQNVWAKIAINNAIGAYEIFFQDKLAGVIGGNYAAVTLLTAFRDGIASALPQQQNYFRRGTILQEGTESAETKWGQKYFGRASGTRNDSKLNGSASSGPADRWHAPGAMTPPTSVRALKRGALERGAWSVEFGRLSAKNLGRASNPTSKIREADIRTTAALRIGDQPPRDLAEQEQDQEQEQEVS